MTPPLNQDQLKLLNKLFYEDKMMFGRDKLFSYIKEHHEGMKISRRQVADFLSNQEIHQLYKNIKTPRTIKSSIATAPHKMINIDLIDLQNFALRGYNYILHAIDTYSKFTYAVAMKNKNDKTALSAIKTIHKKIGNLGAIKSDNGSEFINTLFQDYLKRNNIKHILTEAGKPQSNGLIERANGVLKNLIKKSLLVNDDFDWVKNLQKLVKNVNSTIQKGVNTTPAEIEKAFKNNDEAFLEQVLNYTKGRKRNTIAKQMFYVGDRVRLRVEDDKDKALKWSKQIYKVEKVYKPRTDYGVFQYKLEDFKTKLKQEELQKIKSVENRLKNIDKWRVSKIIKPTVKNNEPYYEVRWVGYTEHTIEPRENLLKDIPKMLKAFEKDVEWYKEKNGRIKWKIVKD